MNDSEAGPSETVAADPDYEPPMVVDFGEVFDVTHGSTSGSSDKNGQESV